MSGEFVEFLKANRSWLRVEAYRLCRDWFEADDLVQITLWNMHKKWEFIAENRKLKSYSRRVLFNAYISERRKAYRKREVSCAEIPERYTEGWGICENLTLMAALDRLSDRQREVIILRFYIDLSVEYTATILGCSPGTVTSHTRRGLDTLRTLMVTG